MLSTRRITGIALVAVLLQLVSVAAVAQSADRIQGQRNFFALPVELDSDFGAANGNARILRIQPLYTWPVRDRWKLVNLTMVTLADAPSGTPVFPGEPGSGNNTGLSDLLHASFYTPVSDGNFIWGLGASVSLPTATESGLGSGKWAAGPAVRLAYRTAEWSIGAVGVQRWSFAGSGNKPDVNQLLIRGAIRRQLNDDWYFVSAPIIVANWDASGEKWLVPVGGGVGRRFTLGDHPWALSAQAYYNVIRADGAPDWVLRMGIVSAIPSGNKPL